MGIFSKKPKSDDTASVKVKPVTEKVVTKNENSKSVGVKIGNFSAILRNPRITEKAAHVSDNNVYTFDIFPKTTKSEIAKAVKQIYGFSPVKVNVTAIPTKRVFRQKHIGIKRGGRKAYVFLKKGDKIEFI